MFIYELSQNNLHNTNLVRKLISISSITLDDTVLDIGAGKGILTKELSLVTGKTIAIEIDPVLANGLKKQFNSVENVEVRCCDFLKMQLPNQPYKVFSNIPYTFTSEIIRKLVWSKNSAEDIFMVVQKEAAQKLLGIPNSNLFSIILNVEYEVSILHYFKRSDFSPMPSVDSVLLRLQRRSSPVVDSKHLVSFKDFTAYGYLKHSQSVLKGLLNIFSYYELMKVSKACNIDLDQKSSTLIASDWVRIFNFINQSMFHMKLLKAKGSMNMWQAMQSCNEKQHRAQSK